MPKPPKTTGKNVTLSIDGLEEVSQRITDVVRGMGVQAANALRAEAELIMTEAKQRTPVDTGALRASGFVTGPQDAHGAVEVTLQFGGPAAPYAIIVHEDLNAHHNVGQAKYLESAMLEASKDLPKRIADRIDLTTAEDASDAQWNKIDDNLTPS